MARASWGSFPCAQRISNGTMTRGFTPRPSSRGIDKSRLTVHFQITDFTRLQLSWWVVRFRLVPLHKAGETPQCRPIRGHFGTALGGEPGRKACCLRNFCNVLSFRRQEQSERLQRLNDTQLLFTTCRPCTDQTVGDNADERNSKAGQQAAACVGAGESFVDFLS
jgi:hypothetical protein